MNGSALHNEYYAVFFYAFISLPLYDQPQPFQLPPVLQARGHNIDSCGIDAAVAQHVRQLRDVLFYGIKRSREQLAQVMGKYLAG